MTTTETRKISTKKELAAWLAENGIAIAAPLRQKDGALHFTPVLPPGVNGVMIRQQFRIAGRGLERLTRYQYDQTKHVSGLGIVPMTPEEIEQQDARMARLNEIDDLLQAVRNVYLSLH